MLGPLTYGSLAQGGFSPLNIGIVEFWFRAHDITGLVDGQAITTWPDISGRGKHATQATAGLKPLYKTNQQNGYPGVLFDGVDDLMATAAITNAIKTWVIVIKRTGSTSPGGNKWIVNQYKTGTNRYGVFQAGGGADDLTAYHLNGSASFTESNELLGTTTKLFIATINGVDNVLYQNGEGRDSSAGVAITHTNAAVFIGGFETSNPFTVDGTIMEAIGYSTVPTPAQLAQLADYLNTKYAIYTAPYVPLASVYTRLGSSATNYDAFGTALVADDNAILWLGRRGTTHASDNGKIIKWRSADGGDTWAVSDQFDDATYDDRNAAGGKTAAGTIVLFTYRYNGVDLQYRRSTDNGASWTLVGTINVGSDTIFSPYGPLVVLPSGRLMQTFYGRDTVPNYRLYVQFSDDDGLTWGGGVDVVNSTTIIADEGAACYIDGATDGTSRLVIVTRNSAGAMRQYSSTDGGATWAFDGVPNFSSGVNTDVSPWLFKDGTILYCIWADRAAFKLRYVTATAANVPGNAAAWGTPRAIHNMKASLGSEFGYPAIVKYGSEVFTFFSDGLGADDPDVLFG